jgi:ankyrin repeat protein
MDEENNDEVYNTPNSVQQPQSNQFELSETDLNKKHKEFLNAIRTENYDLIDDMIANYQERYNIINRVEPETNQTSIFLAAILNGDENATKISQMLIDNGGNILYKDSYQQTAFFHVAREGKPNLVQLYHDNGANMNEQDNFKQTPLFYAARDGRTDAVRQMCELGSDPNILDQVNENALFYAAREGKFETCK